MNENKVEFLQFPESQKKRDILERLHKSINGCTSLKGAIAFWTINPGKFSHLADKLKHPESYCCVDIHKPADVDELERFAKKGANIYLFLYRLRKETCQPLLHSKLLVFEYSDEKVEIWIGSQNFTDRAISGLNLEATSIITTRKNTELYKNVISYLNFIRTCCEEMGKIYPKMGAKFNINYTDFYKKLQNTYNFDKEKYQVIDFICKNVKDVGYIASIRNNNECPLILITGFISEKDLNNCRLNREILIRALDTEGNTICYQAKVLVTGKIAPISEKNVITKYVGENVTKHYEISGYIVRKKDNFPFFELQYTVTGKPFSIIIEIIKEFEEDLYPFEKIKFWKTYDSNKVGDLTYPKSIVREKVQVEIPISPEPTESIKGEGKKNHLYYSIYSRKSGDLHRQILDYYNNSHYKGDLVRDMVTTRHEESTESDLEIDF